MHLTKVYCKLPEAGPSGGQRLAMEEDVLNIFLDICILARWSQAVSIRVSGPKSAKAFCLVPT